MTTYLNFQGVGVAFYAASQALHRWLRHDFHAFYRDAKNLPRRPHLRLEVKDASQRPKGWRPLWVTPRSVWYVPTLRENRAQFFGNVWVRYRYREGKVWVYGDPPTHTYEACRHALLSFVGERLDHTGLHRLHGLGVRVQDKGSVLLGRSGTGKSTLAWHLLLDARVQLLSDDTPLLNAQGELVAFPERIALKEKPSTSAPIRKFRTARYGEKYIVSGKGFLKKIAPKAPLQEILIATRTQKRHSRIVPASRYELLWPLLKWLILGYETPQIAELFLRPSLSDLVGKGRILVKRAQAALSAYRKSQVLRFEISTDPQEAARALLAHLTATDSHQPSFRSGESKANLTSQTRT